MFSLTVCMVVAMTLLSFIAQHHANIVGIDFASDSIKVAIVQPGTPLEIGKMCAVLLVLPTLCVFFSFCFEFICFEPFFPSSYKPCSEQLSI
jgi:quinol-cytochrome oxidoreductase complex cytochrome b subunit